MKASCLQIIFFLLEGVHPPMTGCSTSRGCLSEHAYLLYFPLSCIIPTSKVNASLTLELIVVWEACWSHNTYLLLSTEDHKISFPFQRRGFLQSPVMPALAYFSPTHHPLHHPATRLVWGVGTNKIQHSHTTSRGHSYISQNHVSLNVVYMTQNRFKVRHEVFSWGTPWQERKGQWALEKRRVYLHWAHHQNHGKIWWAHRLWPAMHDDSMHKRVISLLSAVLSFPSIPPTVSPWT